MPNKSKDNKVLTKTQNNLIVGSEKLFRNSLTNVYTKLFTQEHDVALLPSNNKSSQERTNDLYNSLRKIEGLGYDNKVFIGLGKDSTVLFNLYLDYATTFDVAIFINMDWQEHESVYGRYISKITNQTKIYNLYGKHPKHKELAFANVNQQVPKYLSPLVTEQYALEAVGLLTYDYYDKLYLNDSVGALVSL